MGAFQRATETGVNPLRTTLMMHHPLLPHLAAVGARTGFGSDRLRWGPLKIFIDGSLIGRTAAVTQPFLHDPQPDNLGLLMMGEAVFREIVMDAHRAGWQVAVHAIGDRAIALVLDAYEAALDAYPRADHRHRIEHCGILRPDLIARIAQRSVVVVPQPVFITEYGDSFIRHLGPERAALTYPLRSLLDANIPIGLPGVRLRAIEKHPGQRHRAHGKRCAVRAIRGNHGDGSVARIHRDGRIRHV